MTKELFDHAAGLMRDSDRTLSCFALAAARGDLSISSDAYHKARRLYVASFGGDTWWDEPEEAYKPMKIEALEKMSLIYTINPEEINAVYIRAAEIIESEVHVYSYSAISLAAKDLNLLGVQKVIRGAFELRNGNASWWDSHPDNIKARTQRVQSLKQMKIESVI